ncbi:MAG: hypothetical protein LBK26_02125 [Rickettsiales bacterium]|jgi:hypothetical protein|nr:hypothetical protein [Rickettsiales bacterium]
MKKIILATLIGAIALGTANASPNDADQYGVRTSVFNPIYRPLQNDWALQAGFAFQTGAHQGNGGQTDIASGDFTVGDVKVAYGVMDNLYVSFDVYKDTFEINPYFSNFIIGQFANPELGINWQIFRPSKSFALDLIGKYGIAWTKDATTDQRIGMNNLQAGLHIYGDEGMFQWGVQSLAQYAFTPEGMAGMWNLLSRAEAEFEIVDRVGLKGQFDYNVYNMNEGDSAPVIYDRVLALGVVWDVSPAVAAIQPYVSYHFQTANSADSSTLPNNFWQIGAKFGIQF